MDQVRSSKSCSWCQALVPCELELCWHCQHQAHVPRKQCQCERCQSVQHVHTLYTSPGELLPDEEVPVIVDDAGHTWEIRSQDDIERLLHDNPELARLWSDPHGLPPR